MMLTSFFGKSSPINFLLLSIFIGLFGLLSFFWEGTAMFQWMEFLKVLGIIILLVFSMLLLDFFIRKNYLNTSNTFAIFVFSCSVAVLPSIKNLDIVFAQFLQLLAFRRIFSLNSGKNMEKKILDAALWISLASYFYFWSILLLGVLYLAIANLPSRKVRYFLIPPIGICALFSIATAYFLVVENSFDWFWHWPEKISLHFTPYAYPKLLIFITLFLSITVWSLFFRLSNTAEVPKKYRNNYLLVVFATIASFFVVLFSAQKSGGELLFLVAPSSIVIAGYLEKKGDMLLKELIMWCILFIPFTIFFL
ncbi:MAG: DUF6427 family protein [Flavobacteriaceae bacterium]